MYQKTGSISLFPHCVQIVEKGAFKTCKRPLRPSVTPVLWEIVEYASRIFGCSLSGVLISNRDIIQTDEVTVIHLLNDT